MAGCHASDGLSQKTEISKIKFAMDSIRSDGLRGSSDGLRSLSYEFCVPADDHIYQEIRQIDPSVQILQGSTGRIGCSTTQEALCLGDTGHPHWKESLIQLTQKPYITEIRESFFE
jgi:hypothetical protein